MRALALLPPCLLFAVAATAIQLPPLQPFLAAVALPLSFSDYFPPPQEAAPKNPDLRKRQFSNTCPTHFHACGNLGAPNLCCASAAVCSADFAGNVACCPVGAACSGTIDGIITAGTVNSYGGLLGGASTTAVGVGSSTTPFVFASATTASNNGLVPANIASTTTVGNGQPAIIAGSSFVASPAGGVRGAEVVSCAADRPTRSKKSKLANDRI